MKRYGFLVSCIILACGVMWSNLALARPVVSQCRPSNDCKRSIVLAKKATADKPVCFEKVDCLTTTNNCDDCIWSMTWGMEINSKDFLCDETKNIIPDKSILLVKLKYHIRRNGPCGTPVGTHEGTFTITSPTGASLVTSGKIKGTMGFDTHATGDECCHWPDDEGCMEGNIKVPVAGTNTTKDCKLTATYSSTHGVPTGITDVCNKEYWANTSWTLFIDGIVQCPCNPEH